MLASSAPSIISMRTPVRLYTSSATCCPLVDSRIAEVAQARYFSTWFTFISKLNACIVSANLSVFSSEMSPSKNTSAPKRIGTRTKLALVNFGASLGSSNTFDMSNLTPFDPMSIVLFTVSKHI